MMNRNIRQQVYDKYAGHCAYCGKEIAYKDMQVDHIVPIWHNIHDGTLKLMRVTRGNDCIDNLFPSCRACNFRKGTLSIEQFRQQIKEQCDTMLRTFQGRMSLAYGLIERVDKPVVFYFETNVN
ncbi:MAG: HNH endonuclease [Bacteroidales bacterium]|nr:HNH endonuclease [Bacteroidales bacterium]